MKYIKEYNHEFYYAITQDEYDLLRYKDSNIYFTNLFISKSDIEIITNFSNTISDEIRVFKVRLDGRIKIEIPNHNYKNYDIFWIQPLEDEWYLCPIRINDKWSYYKCDQIEGVLKLLKDIIK